MPKYNYEWAERKNGQYQDGCAENWWWYCFNKLRRNFTEQFPNSVEEVFQ